MAEIYGERWETVKSLGEGGQAHTFIVRDTKSGSEDWVLKRLKNKERLGRFELEIQTLAKLESKLIPRVEDHSLDGRPYFVYPFLGPTLADVVRNERPSFDVSIDLFRDVVEAAAVAHGQGVTHRDIKPDNVVVDRATAATRRAYLIDFGVCQWDDGGLFLTTTDEPFGNRDFAAPECGLGSPIEPNALSDVYSLGKLLYWILTGGHYFVRETLSPEVLARIPEPRGVERAYVRRWLQSTVVENQSKRLASQKLMARIERDAKLMRANTNAVGASNQLCPTCRLGQLRRRERLEGIGFSTAGDPPRDIRVLHCDYCGYLQFHATRETISEEERLWEI
jgi:serine/threonine protein kinase